MSVTLAARADGRLDLHARILDLRKRGFVPVAGDLQPSGVIHDMRLTGTIDPAEATLETIVAEQPNVAFEATATTGGECCRDPIDRIRALAGARLDAGFGRRLAAEIGGPRGCSHLLVLGHLAASAAIRSLDRDRALHGPAPRRAAGERVFRRDLVVDGQEPAEGALQLAAQLTDLHLAPAPALAPPMNRFAEELEVRVETELAFPGGEIGAIRGAERHRGSVDFERASWREHDAALAWLVGRRFGAGITAELLQRLGDGPDERPLLDTLLALAPTMVQCAAAMSDAWAAAARGAPSRIGLGGLPDSCYMWRREGALAQARAAEAAAGPKRA